MSVFLIGISRVDDDAKMAEYGAKAGGTLPPDAKLVIADQSASVIEGSTDQTRVVVLEFPSEKAFRGWYESSEYQAALPLRLESTTGITYLAQGAG